MQDTDLLANHPPDNEQRFDQHDQVGNILDQLLDACFKPGRPHHTHLKPEVA